MWEQCEHEGPLQQPDTTGINLAQQNIGDAGLWFLFSLLDLTRPIVLTMDLSFNAITGHGTPLSPQTCHKVTTWLSQRVMPWVGGRGGSQTYAVTTCRRRITVS